MGADRRERVLRHRADPPGITGRAGSGNEIPSTVSDVVLSRLSALPAASRRIVGVAAVIGREFDAVLLAAATATEVDGILDQLDPVLATGLVIERSAGQFQFSHALVRDAIGSALPPTRRALRHAEIAAALDREQSLDLRRGRPRRPSTGWPPDRNTPGQPGGQRPRWRRTRCPAGHGRRRPTC